MRVKDRSGALGPDGRGFRRVEVVVMRLSVARKLASRSTGFILWSRGKSKGTSRSRLGMEGRDERSMTQRSSVWLVVVS